jgi:hypothetical protein
LCVPKIRNPEEILKNVNNTFTHALFQSLKESPSPLGRPTTPTAVLREIVVLSPSCEYQRHPKIENTQTKNQATKQNDELQHHEASPIHMHRDPNISRPPRL